MVPGQNSKRIASKYSDSGREDVFDFIEKMKKNGVILNDEEYAKQWLFEYGFQTVCYEGINPPKVAKDYLIDVMKSYLLDSYYDALYGNDLSEVHSNEEITIMFPSFEEIPEIVEEEHEVVDHLYEITERKKFSSLECQLLNSKNHLNS